MFFAKKISISFLELNKILKNHFVFENINIENSVLKIKKYPNDSLNNLEIFIKKIVHKENNSATFFKINNLKIEYSKIILDIKDTQNFHSLAFKDINGEFENLKINKGKPTESFIIKSLTFRDNFQKDKTKLKGEFIFLDEKITISNIFLERKNSLLQGNIIFNNIKKTLKKTNFNAFIYSNKFNTNDFLFLHKSFR